MGRERLPRAIKLLAAFGLAPVLVLYAGAALFAVAIHIGEKSAPSILGEWVAFMHLEAIYVTYVLSPLAVLASLFIVLPAYLLIKKRR